MPPPRASQIKRTAHTLVILYSAVWLCILVPLAVLSRLWRRRDPMHWRLLWAGAPMPSLATTSRAMQRAGHYSLSLATHTTANTPPDLFDLRLDRVRSLPAGLNAFAYCTRAASVFARQLFLRDVVHIFFSGGVLNQMPLRDWEPRLWKLAGVRIVVMPYGSDAFIYRDLPNETWARELQRTYPRTLALDEEIAKRVRRFSDMADAVVGAIVHTATLPRVDVWPILWYPAGRIAERRPYTHDVEAVRIAHPTNHRAIKGTKLLIDAVHTLRKEGLLIDLDIIEGVDMEESRARMACADIIFDQLHMGYAMTAIEGMAMGKPVLSGIGSGPIYAPFETRSYLSECPIIRVSPDTLLERLREVIVSATLRDASGKAGKEYVAHRHGDFASVELFREVYRAIADGEVERLETLYAR